MYSFMTRINLPSYLPYSLAVLISYAYIIKDVCNIVTFSVSLYTVYVPLTFFFIFV